MIAPDSLREILHAFGLRPETSRFLRDSQNCVYSCEDAGRKFIIRVSRSRHRDSSQVRAELAWISFLIQRGIKACAPIPAGNGDLCPSFEFDGQVYIVTCFEHAPGHEITLQDITQPLYEKLGAMVGSMHAAAVDFNATRPALDRPKWDESRLLREDVAGLGDSLTDKFRSTIADLVRDLRSYPLTSQNHGLIHGDVSFGNYFIHEGDLWIFDFDNCEYGYFAQDLATVLYDSIYCKVLNKFADAQPTERMIPFWKAFWSAYSKTGPLNEIDTLQFKNFFLLREAIIFVHYHRTMDLRNIDDPFRMDLEVMRRNVENLDHQVDFDYLFGNQT
jgi:Ser/Thr protein kinase RdoA (MazF antagonist)